MFFFFQAEDGIRDSSVTGVQTCAHPPRIHGNDLVIKSRETALPLGYDLGLERRLAIPGRFQFQLAKVSLQLFPARAVTRVPAAVTRRVVVLKSQMIGQLRRVRPIPDGFW